MLELGALLLRVHEQPQRHVAQHIAEARQLGLWFGNVNIRQIRSEIFVKFQEH